MDKIKKLITCLNCGKDFEKMLPADIGKAQRFCCPACEQEAKQKGNCVICKKPGTFHLH